MDTEAKIIEEKNKQIEANAKKTVDTIKTIYSGAMSGLNVLGDLFQAKMNLAKTKAEKIKKDTTLTAEEQEKLLAEQQQEYNKAFEANKKIQIATTTISTLAAATVAEALAHGALGRHHRCFITGHTVYPRRDGVLLFSRPGPLPEE